MKVISLKELENKTSARIEFANKAIETFNQLNPQKSLLRQSRAERNVDEMKVLNRFNLK